MKNRIVKTYDDDVRIFLIECLRRVDYLKNCDEEILVHLAYNFKPETREKGAFLYRCDEEEDLQIRNEMIIVFEGVIEIVTDMDAGTEFAIELLTTGSILNPHNFLVDRKHIVNYRFQLNSTFFYIKYGNFIEVAQ